MKTIHSFFKDDSALAKNIANYEYRSQQTVMACAVAKTISKGSVLLAEAGCGTGKSIAYLLPLALWAQKEDSRKAVISTYTKTLQQQLIEKDLPLLQKTLDNELTYELCLGNKNYICLRRMQSTSQIGLFETIEESEMLKDLSDWLDKDGSGIKMDIDFPISEALWADVCRNPELCSFQRCRHFRHCYYFKARIRQSKADILVANHHLVLSDAAAGGTILPPHKVIVFDEAHNIEDIASETMGFSISKAGTIYLLGKIGGKKRSLIDTHKTIPKKIKAEIRKKIKSLRAVAEVFFEEVITEFGTKNINYRLRRQFMIENMLSSAFLELSDILNNLEKNSEDSSLKLESAYYMRRTKEFATSLENILNVKDPDMVYSLRITSSRKWTNVIFYAAPIEVAEILKTSLFEKYDSTILTSATLSVKKSFDYIKERLGIDVSVDIKIESPFDFKKKAVLYIPEKITSPSNSFQGFQEDLLEQLSEILSITQGRTFILFTSYSMLNETAAALLDRFTELNFLIQGELPRAQMMSEFAQNPNSVLMGTSTFWQGVDFPGRALECVVITKLPFAVPDNPLTEARIQQLNKKGINAFMEYQIPQAALMLKQGAGRLIRHREDFGIIAIMDPRIKRSRYGQVFLDSLPDYRQTSSIPELREIYSDMTKGLGDSF